MKQLMANFKLWAVLAVLALAGSYMFGGQKGAAGFAMGLAATAFNNWGLWGIVKLTGASAHETTPARVGAFINVLAFLIKLPIFVGLAILTQRIGGAALPCFLIGLAMVYFATLGWALARS